MLADELDLVTSLALDSIALMCEADALDFYKAWPVVCKQMPTLPRDRPRVAASWVALVGHGQLDVRAHPERAATLLDLLWLASRDPSALVIPVLTSLRTKEFETGQAAHVTDLFGGRKALPV